MAVAAVTATFDRQCVCVCGRLSIDWFAFNTPRTSNQFISTQTSLGLFCLIFKSLTNTVIANYCLANSTRASQRQTEKGKNSTCLTESRRFVVRLYQSDTRRLQLRRSHHHGRRLPPNRILPSHWPSFHSDYLQTSALAITRHIPQAI